MILRPYQEIGRDFLANKTRALLADEMRIGKTPQAILAADKIGAKNVLVVCPAIGTAHWQAEWKKWSPLRPNAYVLNSKDLRFNASLTVASYDMAAKWADKLCKREWDVLIPDECHFAKNPAAVRTNIIYGKNSIAWSSERIWALSGTPAPRHAGELWPMLRAYGVTFMSYWEFLKWCCRVDLLSGRVFGTREDMIPEVRQLLDKIMLRRKRKEVAPEMDAIAFNFLEVTPSSIADIPIPKGLSDSDLTDWLGTNAVNAQENRQEVAKAKVGPLVEEITFAIQNKLLEQTIVFGFHVEPLEQLTAALNARGIPTALINGSTPMKQRLAIQDDLRYNRISVLAANIIAAGTVIDLSAARHAYFLELDWVPGNNLQAANRMIDMEKKEPVTIDVVTWPGSADDKIQQVLTKRVRELALLY